MKPIARLIFPIFLVACQSTEIQPLITEIPIAPSDSINLAPLGIFTMTALDVKDSLFYLLDRNAKKVVWTSADFSPLGSYSSVGRGPGEFTSPSDLQVTANHVFLIDFGQRKVMRFSRELTPELDFVTEHPPLSIISVDEQRLWMGTLNMEFEDVYSINLVTQSEVLEGQSVKIRYAPEGVVFHAKNPNGVILRYRQFNHRLDVFDSTGTRTSFVNPTQPERPELDPRTSEAPIFKSKTHHSGFVTSNRACVLSGDHTPRSQSVQCFSFDGTLISRYKLSQEPSMISVYSDSTLYTYSPTTNHVYVYKLDF
jgi:hypothetical protein